MANGKTKMPISWKWLFAAPNEVKIESREYLHNIYGVPLGRKHVLSSAYRPQKNPRVPMKDITRP